MRETRELAAIYSKMSFLTLTSTFECLCSHRRTTNNQYVRISCKKKPIWKVAFCRTRRNVADNGTATRHAHISNMRQPFKVITSCVCVCVCMCTNVLMSVLYNKNDCCQYIIDCSVSRRY